MSQSRTRFDLSNLRNYLGRFFKMCIIAIWRYTLKSILTQNKFKYVCNNNNNLFSSR